MSKKTYIVGITGGSASGKTLFLNRLRSAFSTDELTIISQDDYYKKREFQPLDERGVENFDTPFSIDSEAFARDIRALCEGRSVEKEEYTFNNPALTPKIHTYTPAPILIVEGIFVFYFPEIAKMLDLKIFLDAKEYIKLKRRIIRDRNERGYDIEDVLYRYENHVAPTYERYIEPFKNDADIIIPNNAHFDKALEVLTGFLRSKFGKDTK
ncbi:MAG TPA: uridine kinase [Cytophagaceae bacterium]